MTAVGRGALRARFDFSLSALYLQHPAGPRPEARPFRDWRVGVGKARPLSPGPSWRTHSGTVVVLLGCVLRVGGPPASPGAIGAAGVTLQVKGAPWGSSREGEPTGPAPGPGLHGSYCEVTWR